MSSELKDLDPVPLVERLLDKSRSGRLEWEPTADAKVFVASIGGEATFRIRLVEVEDIDDHGRTITIEDPRLDMLDEKGCLLWDIRNVEGGALSRLYEVARRIGNRLEQETFLKKLRRYPVERALSRVGDVRKERNFRDLVQYVLQALEKP
jgi:hypothetical protein